MLSSGTLIWWWRLDYFSSRNTRNFNQDGNHDLSKVLKKLANKAGLLGTSIYEIQASWTGPEELKQANYTLRSLSKGLKFLRAVPTMESPKVMGLMGIHDPDALWHFASFTYCPWCGKEGHNGGTVVNHLRTTHYKLGLVCDKCYGCPTITSDTLHCHGCHNCCWVKSLLLLSQSCLTNPSSGPLLRSQGGIFYSGSPGKKARLISEEGSVCQSANPSIVHTKFNKAATCFEELQFPVIYIKILDLTFAVQTI